MAGHSKWANIKHRKGAQDAKRSKIYQKITKEMQVAIKEKGADPDTNPRLRLLVEKAKSENMPNDNIKRILDKANQDTSNWQEVNFEGYGPSGVAVFVETLTDNNNRTVASVKSIFKKAGGNLGTAGSVSYLFETKGQIVIDGEGKDADEIMMIAMDLPVIDMKDDEGTIVIETDSSNFIEVKNGLEAAGITDFLKAEVTKLPSMEVDLDESGWEKLQRLVDNLEDDDDVSNVYHNAA